MALRKNERVIGRRTTKRISLKIPVEVSGQDEHGSRFQVRAEMVNASSKGGCLILDRDLLRGQKLKITSPKGIAFMAKVRWSNWAMNKNVRYVGFELDQPTKGWVIMDKPKSAGLT
jgi:hypothetical protein